MSQVSKLQSVLASVENFTVSEPAAPPRSAGLRFASGHSYGTSSGYRSFGSGDGSSLSSGLAALTQPFKLRLARADHEKQLKDYATNVVLIEPLASMTAVEDFLWSKVYRSSASPPPSAAPATTVSSGVNAAEKAAAAAAAACVHVSIHSCYTHAAGLECWNTKVLEKTSSFLTSSLLLLLQLRLLLFHCRIVVYHPTCPCCAVTACRSSGSCFCSH